MNLVYVEYQSFYTRTERMVSLGGGALSTPGGRGLHCTPVDTNSPPPVAALVSCGAVKANQRAVKWRLLPKEQRKKFATTMMVSAGVLGL